MIIFLTKTGLIRVHTSANFEKSKTQIFFYKQFSQINKFFVITVLKIVILGGK